MKTIRKENYNHFLVMGWSGLKHILSCHKNQLKHTSLLTFNGLTTMIFFNLILKKKMNEGQPTLLRDNYSRTQIQFKLSIK